MKTVVIDAKEMSSREEAHSYLAERLTFPQYYGKNLDALYDCLTDIAEPINIVLYNFSTISLASKSFIIPLLKVLTDSIAENKNLTLLYDAETGYLQKND